MANKRIHFFINLAILSVAGSPSAFTQSLFWQRMNLDSATIIATIASNACGDIFAGDDLSSSPGLYRSTDNGEHWDTLDIGYPLPSVRFVTIDPNGGVLACANRGVYYSS